MSNPDQAWQENRIWKLLPRLFWVGRHGSSLTAGAGDISVFKRSGSKLIVFRWLIYATLKDARNINEPPQKWKEKKENNENDK